jgi:hypothetical protein
VQFKPAQAEPVVGEVNGCFKQSGTDTLSLEPVVDRHPDTAAVASARGGLDMQTERSYHPPIDLGHQVVDALMELG